MTGRLLIVGTPIGNLDDLSPRAAAAFASADTVACEDTRRTGRLLRHLGVHAPRVVRMDEHTEERVAAQLIERVRAGETVVVASDAGMPGVSDPGVFLIARAADAELRVEVVPGPFAGVVAAVGSALLDRSGRFCFEGFLPRRGPGRAERLRALVDEPRTIVLYEAPHRVQRTLGDLAATLGSDRAVAVCRELTKLHEQTWRGTLEEAVDHWDGVDPRGEFVLVIDGAPEPAEVGDEALLAALEQQRLEGVSKRDAAAWVSRRFGVAPNRVKRLQLDP